MSNKGWGKAGWLGSKDSNLDFMIQSHESCRWTTSQPRKRYYIELEEIIKSVFVNFGRLAPPKGE